MTLNNNGDLIPEIVRRGFQDLLEAEVCALTGAQLHERCSDQRSTQRNGYRERLRQGSFFPRWLEQSRRGDGGLHRRDMHRHLQIIGDPNLSGLDKQVKAFLQRPLEHVHGGNYVGGRLPNRRRTGACPFPLRLPRCHLHPRQAGPQPTGGFAVLGGPDRDQ